MNAPRIKAAAQAAVAAWKRFGSTSQAEAREFEKLKSAEILPEVLSAFEILADSERQHIIRFFEVFDERSKIPELNESRGLDALPDVLANALWGQPPKIYFEKSEGAATESQRVEDVFRSRFRTALQKIADEEPHVLCSLKRYHDESNFSYYEILRAVMIMYADSKDVLGF